MLYLLDFDRTVFDMEQLYRTIDQQNPRATLGTVASLAGIDLAGLLFPDALAFFATHRPAQIEIISSCFGLSGQWELAYQTAKVQQSGVDHYVAAVHIVPDSKVTMIKRLTHTVEHAVYVDDHPEHIKNAVQTIPRVTVVYLDRSGARRQIAGAQTISSLAELDAIITPI
jgi:hypothetical protein